MMHNCKRRTVEHSYNDLLNYKFDQLDVSSLNLHLTFSLYLEAKIVPPLILSRRDR